VRTIILIAFIFLLTACGDENNQPQIAIPESAQIVSLVVSNMTCATCGPTVRKALQQVNGVYKATVDVKANTATVYYDASKTSVPNLTQATTVAGYPSEILL